MSDDEKLDNEACRRVLILLFGSEVKALEFGAALEIEEAMKALHAFRCATPEEETAIARLHEEGDRLAREVARANYPPDFVPMPEGRDTVEVEPKLTPEEEAEFDAWCTKVYERAEKESKH